MYHDILKAWYFGLTSIRQWLTFLPSQLENAAAAVVNDVVLHTKAGSTCLGFEQTQLVRRNWGILEPGKPNSPTALPALVPKAAPSR